ncbi:MAG: hypothetical protein M3O35_16295 [Acidobacteriota bacterium]|nr:hypothetical protein [Acidobacteriota bacterium]
MNTNFGRLLMTIGFSAVLGSSFLQAQPKPRGRVEIPFAFHVRDTTLPAGTYTVEEYNTVTVAIINDQTGKAILAISAHDRWGSTEESKLVFHKYGERYFLAELWFAGKGVGDSLPMGKLEREVSNAPAAIATVAMR